MQNHYLDYLIDPFFQEVSKFFALSFENCALKTIHAMYFLPTVEIKN